MKQLVFILLVAIFANVCIAQPKAEITTIVEKIDSLFLIKSYFKARDLFEGEKEQIDEQSTLRISATLNNIFNEIERSKIEIDQLIKNVRFKLNRVQTKNLLITQLSNSVKLFDYKNADRISKILVSEYTDIIPSGELWGIRNNNIIWGALATYPKQEVEITADSNIKIFRDAIGLKNLNIKVVETNFPFIFDTGANLSVVIESQAKAMNLDIINTKVSVNTITGQRINSKVGVAPSFTLGNINFRNVVFLIFPDEALFIKEVKFQIKGILGFPVIEAMKEVHFFKADELFIPHHVDTIVYTKNLAIEYLTPIINLQMKSAEMHFTFDTGASTTSLYNKYYQAYKNEILENYEETEIQFAGAGGGTSVKGYYVKFRPLINDKLLVVQPVAVIPEIINESDRYSYGNIGQDLILKFDKMIINFESMFIRFE